MAHHIVRKRGIPALVCAESDLEYQTCSLAIKCSRDHEKATISLRRSFPIDDLEDQRTFTILYDANNLVPGTVSLKPAKNISSTLANQIAQGGNADIKTLSLMTKNHCPVWCPKSKANKEERDACLQKFLNLTRASETKILIVFDYNWVQEQNYARLKWLIDHPETLTGFPVYEHCTISHIYMPTYWNDVSSAVEAVHEPPPPYPQPTKRCRTTSPSTSSPSSKRTLHVLASAGSPTEEATPSPKAPLSIPHESNFQDAVTSAVETVLTGILTNFVPPSSPSPPPSNKSPHRNAYLKSSPHPLSHSFSALRTLLSARIASCAEAKLKQIFDSTLEHAADVRNVADMEFFEILEDSKYDVILAKEDGIMELNEVVNDKLAELREKADELFGQLEERWEATSMEGEACEVEEEMRKGDLDKWASELNKWEGDLEKREEDLDTRERKLREKEKILRAKERRMREKVWEKRRLETTNSVEN